MLWLWIFLDVSHTWFSRGAAACTSCVSRVIRGDSCVQVSRFVLCEPHLFLPWLKSLKLMAISQANLKDVVASILHVCACGIGVWCMCTCFMCICVCMSLLGRSEHERRQRRTLVPTLPLSGGRISHETWTSILSLRWVGLQVPAIPFLCLQHTWLSRPEWPCPSFYRVLGFQIQFLMPL